MTYRIASWNINSVRIREPILRRFVQDHAPDILCLQETKVEDHLFPSDALNALGFDHLYFAGQKSYNGVAILSKIELGDVHSIDFLNGKGEKRHISATLPDGTQLHNMYVPAGGDIPDPNENPKFKDKLAFVDAMIAFSRTLAGTQRAIMVGDMNIAPLEHDVWSHKQLLKVVSHTPVEVARMNQLKEAANWVDTHREHVPQDEKLYSWWSYRSRDWAASNRGRRLDHIWVTPELKGALGSTSIIAEARGWDKPSDHVPIFADLEIAA